MQVTLELHGDAAPRKGAQQSPQLFGACISLLCRGRGFCAVVNLLVHITYHCVLLSGMQAGSRP